MYEALVRGEAQHFAPRPSALETNSAMPEVIGRERSEDAKDGDHRDPAQINVVEGAPRSAPRLLKHIGPHVGQCAAAFNAFELVQELLLGHRRRDACRRSLAEALNGNKQQNGESQ